MLNKKIIISGICLLLFTGCQNQAQHSAEKYHETKMNTTTAQNVKEEVLAMDEVTEVEVVECNDKIYIAVKPEQHERFQLEQLKKNIKTTMGEQYPNSKIYVSVDRKISMMLHDLEQDIQNQYVSEKEVKKRLKTVQTEMKSDT